MVKFKSDNADGYDEEERIYCLHHALKNIKNDRLTAKMCKLVFTYSIDEIESLLAKLNDRLQQGKKRNNSKNDAGPSSAAVAKKSAIAGSSKYSGMPTMLK